MTRLGVVVMAYGTPRRREDVAAYYTDIRRGRPPSDEELADLIRRYDAIGGLSPLLERTEAQRDAIAGQLEHEAPGRFHVEIGLRHSEPSIEDAITALAHQGVDEVVGLVLAPHYSAMSVGAYLDRSAKESARLGLGFRGVESWATEPAFIDWLTGQVLACLEHGDLPERTHVLFTAHSLPQRILEQGDPYPAEVAATAELVADRADLLPSRWSVGWQSAGRTAEPWLGPDVRDVIESMAEDGWDALLVCPCGFTADHLEVLYDLDIEARRHAERHGVVFRRTAVVNDDPAVMQALARRVIATSSG